MFVQLQLLNARFSDSDRFVNVHTAHGQYLQLFTFSLVMKPAPLFLLGLTLAALCGPASAQTTPASAPNASLGKGAPHPQKAAASPRTVPMSAVKLDTAAFHRGRPADAILLRVQDLPPYRKTKGASRSRN